MRSLQINSGNLYTFTPVPNLFFDQYMPDASGEFLKVYLYLYRHSVSPADQSGSMALETIAEHLYMTEGDVIRGMKYWQMKGLLSLTPDENGIPAGITLLPLTDTQKPGQTASPVCAAPDFTPSASAIQGCAAPAVSKAAVTGRITTADETVTANKTNTANKTDTADEAVTADGTVISNETVISDETATADEKSQAASELCTAADTALCARRKDTVRTYTKPQYSMQEISDFSEKNRGDQLFFILQQYMGHMLSHTEINSIVFFHEGLGFSTDLIEYLFEYCIGNNHRSIHYIEKVAISWAEAGIDTVSKAKGRSAIYNRTHYAVLRAFGISGRNPAKVETEYIDKWTDEYCFSAPLIVEACNRTMSATHTPSFEYADKILKNWHLKKVVSLDDVKAIDATYEKEKQEKTKYGKNKYEKTKYEKGNYEKGSYEKGSCRNGKYTNAGGEKGQKATGSQNRFNNFSQRTYNYTELEQKLARKIQTGSDH